jgi:hypothetical protein
MATKEDSGSQSRSSRGGKPWGIAIALVLGVGTVAALPRIFAKAPEAHAAPSEGNATCGDQYNALVKQAKASLTKGDRNGAIHWLLAARTQLDRCQKLEELNSSEEIDVALLAGVASGS